MNKNTHKISTYNDGQRAIEFCIVCGYEDLQLLEPCPGKFVDNLSSKQVDKKQDKD